MRALLLSVALAAGLLALAVPQAPPAGTATGPLPGGHPTPCLLARVNLNAIDN
jgi:hypothetical protein